jgi:two-component system, NarL family, sensor kinase
MKKLLNVLLFLGFFAFSKAEKLDSLLKLLVSAKDDTAKVLLQYEIGYTYGIGKIDSSTYYFEAGKKLSQKLNYGDGVVKYFINYTGLLNDMGKYDTALILNLESVRLANTLPNKNLLANCIANVGNSYLNLRKLDSANYYYLQAEKISIANNDKLRLYILYGNLCGQYASLGQYEKAIDYAKKAIVLHQQNIGDENDHSYLLTNLGGTYQNLRQNDSTVFYATEAIRIAKQTKNYNVWFVNLQNIIYAKVDQKKYAELPFYVKEMEQMEPFMKTPRFEAKLAMNRAIQYYYAKQYAQAEEFGLAAYQISMSNALPSITQKTCRILTKIDAAQGKIAAADDFDAQADSLYDAELNEEVASNVKDIEAKYEAEKKDNEIFKLNTVNKQKSTLNNILFGSAGAFLLIGFLGYRNFRGRQKLQQAKITELEKDKQLMAIDAMLKGQEEERSRIAKDLHDGLGGMLSGTKLSFMNMKENLVLTQENASLFDKSLSMLDNTIGDLRKVAQNLMPEALVKFGLEEALKDYCLSIESSSHLQVEYHFLGEQRELSNTSRVFIYRIVQELVNNAVKHAQAKKLLVQVNMQIAKVDITVEDDGKGYDEAMAAQKKGAGLSNIQYRVQYFNGKIDTITKAGEGTSVHIELNV